MRQYLPNIKHRLDIGFNNINHSVGCDDLDECNMYHTQ